MDEKAWTAEGVLALAPDAASRAAGSKLASAGPWAEAGAGDDAVWGLCKGSGSTPYRSAVDLRGPAYTCSCPSRKFPCKHALGLLLRWAEGEIAAGGGPVPEWAGEWLAGRRERAGRGPVQPERSDAAASGQQAAGPADATAARRRAEQRMQRISAGATELEQRLADLLRDGLASAPRGGTWEETAARMVDAQAPGLAARVRELGALPASGPGWPARLLAECALLHLLDQGFLRLGELPEPLAATVRARVGLTVDAAQLLRGGTLRDTWLVLAQEDADDGKLTTRRIWLRGSSTARMALLLSYGAGSRAPDRSLPTGSVLDAELAYYPGAYPLRAALGDVHAGPHYPADAPGGSPGPGHPGDPSGPSGPSGGIPPGQGIAEAVAAYGEALRADPWLDGIPVVVADVVPVPGDGDGGGHGAGGGGAGAGAGAAAGEGWQLAAADGREALPVHPGAAGSTGAWQLLAVSGGGPVTVFGELGHAGFRPLTTWSAGTAVPLTAGAARSGV